MTLLPVTSPPVRVVTMSSDTAQRELRASPLKPKLASVCTQQVEFLYGPLCT